MKPPFKRMILVPPTTREDFIAYAADAGWKYRSEVQEQKDRLVPYELVYSDAAREKWLHYVDDFVAEMPYLVVAGRHFAETAEQVAEEFPVYADSDLLTWAEAASDPHEVALSCRYVAVTAPTEFDPEFFAALLRGLRHTEATVRAACIHACAYPGWPEFEPVLKEIEQEDPDPRVRTIARQLLHVFRDARRTDTGT
jgi:hypothetical protein